MIETSIIGDINRISSMIMNVFISLAYVECFADIVEKLPKTQYKA